MSLQAVARTMTSELDDDLRSWIAVGSKSSWDQERFDAIARRVHAHQYASIAVARAAWDSLGARPERIRDWREIPPLPNAIFKAARVASFDASEDVRLFRSSGTTSNTRGVHRFSRDTLELYRRSSIDTFRTFVLPDGARLPAVALLPSPEHAPDSSLSAMVGFLEDARAFSTCDWFVRDDVLDDRGVLRRLGEFVEAGQPVLLLGTAFAFVHLCDRMRSRRERLLLPSGSRAMETGGFKGRVRELSRPELLELIEGRLGLPPNVVVNEYGMTELSSQLYSTSLLASESRGEGEWGGPPWLRVRALDPATRLDVPPGEVGVLALYDLANRGSCMAVLTADLGRVHADGTVDVHGRSLHATPRGCSLAFDAAVSGHGAASPAPPVPVVSADEERRVAGLAEQLVAARTELLATTTPMSRAHALGEFIGDWLDPEAVHARSLIAEIAEETQLSKAVVRAGLIAGWEEWTPKALGELVEREWPTFAGEQRSTVEMAGPKIAVVIGAGNLPLPVAFDVMAALIAGAATVVRPSSRCPAFTRRFASALAARMPEWADAIHVELPTATAEPPSSAWMDLADAVIINGTDATVRAVRHLARADACVLGRGSRVTIGVVGAGEPVEEVAAQAAIDIAMWDQRGCLSPAAWVVPESDAEAFAEALDAALDRLEAEWPRGGVDIEEEAGWQAEVEAALAAGAAGRAVSVFGRVVVDGRSESVRPLGGRRVWVFPTPAIDHVPAAVHAWQRQLSTVIVAAAGPDRHLVRAVYGGLGASRFCAPGRAQFPTPRWYHDGREILRPMLQFAAWD